MRSDTRQRRAIDYAAPALSIGATRCQRHARAERAFEPRIRHKRQRAYNDAGDGARHIQVRYAPL